ncbi:MAG TPA: hemolysin III family protein [Solirubrobacteraceae bacterium]|nr:hemolysin III family protein [Solirubrobacteraceae bacterium]
MSPSQLSTPGSTPHPRAAAELIPRLRGVSHALAFLVAIAVAAVVIVIAPPGRATVAAAIYGGALVALFGGSALYHRWPGPARFRPVLQRIDHSTIFVFIAASYTPIALLVLHGPLQWIILAVAWLGATAGVTFSLGWIHAPRALIASSYLALGWVAVIAIPQLLERLALTPLLLLGACGLLYTLGAVVYARRRPDPWPRTFGFHEIFHALVIAAASVHCVAVIGWVLPRA